ncbi:unnamed protein product [Cuscuta epithymum]|uniref:Uncharacterized protein n=1 Tax=Cuscuta epithymum TaxID=186058 RepID=A0AAV0D2T3_9ASTE|nr:unnamed protein product [Cuscuta epithymum]
MDVNSRRQVSDEVYSNDGQRKPNKYGLVHFEGCERRNFTRLYPHTDGSDRYLVSIERVVRVIRSEPPEINHSSAPAPSLEEADDDSLETVKKFYDQLSWEQDEYRRPKPAAITNGLPTHANNPQLPPQQQLTAAKPITPAARSDPAAGRSRRPLLSDGWQKRYPKPTDGPIITPKEQDADHVVAKLMEEFNKNRSSGFISYNREMIPNPNPNPNPPPQEMVRYYKQGVSTGEWNSQRKAPVIMDSNEALTKFAGAYKESNYIR